MELGGVEKGVFPSFMPSGLGRAGDCICIKTLLKQLSLSHLTPLLWDTIDTFFEETLPSIT